MATEFYNLPTVNNEKNTFSFVDSVNGLATSVDETLEQMIDEFHAHPYHLPTATKQQLGGVRIGDGWDVYSDGEITPKDSKYVLPKATNETLGGIIAGQNIICEKGKVSLDEGAYKLDDYTTEMFRDGAVTTDKLADTSITADKCIATIPAELNKLVNSFKNWGRWRFTASETSLYSGYMDVLVFKLGGAYVVSTYRVSNYVPIGDGTSFTLYPSDQTTHETSSNTQLSELFPNTQRITVPLGLWNFEGTSPIPDSYAYMEILPTQNSGYFHLLGKAKGETKITGPKRAPTVRAAGVNIGSTIIFNEG